MHQELFAKLDQKISLLEVQKDVLKEEEEVEAEAEEEEGKKKEKMKKEVVIILRLLPLWNQMIHWTSHEKKIN